MFEYDFMMRHYTEDASIRALAREKGVHPNTLRRAMIKAGIKPRERSDILNANYENGTIKPRKGFTMSEEHKIIISNANHGRKRTSQKKNNVIVKNNDAMRSRGAAKSRESSKKGSKFERMLIDKLTANGYNVKHQYEFKEYKVDLYFPDVKLAVEIDGITHREPIYGIDKLNKTIERDKEKDNQLKQMGINILRIADNQKKPSLFNTIGVSSLINEVIEQIKLGKKVYKVVEIR